MLRKCEVLSGSEFSLIEQQSVINSQKQFILLHVIGAKTMKYAVNRIQYIKFHKLLHQLIRNYKITINNLKLRLTI